MTTFALIGAGPGLGLATARRFGAAGHPVALISRSAAHLDGLVAELEGDGIQARRYTAESSTPAPSPRPCAVPRKTWDRWRSCSSVRCLAPTS